MQVCDFLRRFDDLRYILVNIVDKNAKYPLNIIKNVHPQKVHPQNVHPPKISIPQNYPSPKSPSPDPLIRMTWLNASSPQKPPPKKMSIPIVSMRLHESNKPTPHTHFKCYTQNTSKAHDTLQNPQQSFPY